MRLKRKRGSNRQGLCEEMKGEAREEEEEGEKLKAEWLSMAERRRESKNER